MEMRLICFPFFFFFAKTCCIQRCKVGQCVNPPDVCHVQQCDQSPYLSQILDFGLARSTDAEMTGYVVTRWYRAPEVILNWMHYTQTGKTIVAVTHSNICPCCGQSRPVRAVTALCFVLFFLISVSRA